jgi:pimeloyl-ACP methyl ester carboxylesterase
MSIAGAPTQANGSTSKVNQSSSSALKDIQYGSILDSYGGTSSEDEVEETAELPDDLRSIVGVSISRTQTRLTSPKTPAVEKAAAMEERGGFFNDRWGFPGEPSLKESDQDVSGTNEDSHTINAVINAAKSTPEVTQRDDLEENDDTSTSSSRKLPSPWRAGPKKFQHSEETAGILRQRLDGKRQRSNSGPDSFRMRLPFNIPSLPKGISLFGSGAESESNRSAKNLSDAQNCRDPTQQDAIVQSDGPTSWARESWTDLTSRVRRQIAEPYRGEDSDASLTPTEQCRPISRDYPIPPPATQTEPLRSGVRRVRSDDSMLLRRTLSRASSLGDDSRFENVSEMVNSRLKALKDSFQDTNFKLSLPKAPSIFNSSTPPRASSMFMRQSVSHTSRDTTPDMSSSPEPRHNASFPGSNTKPREGIAGMNAANTASHPFFSKALGDLSGDLVVLGGYRGSILREAKAPHKRVWVPIKVGLNLRKVDLEVGLNPEDEDRMPETIIPGGMLTHIGPVDMAKRLLKRLRASENAQTGRLRIHEYGYDWRLSPHRLSRDLITFLEGLPSNQANALPGERGALVIAHSLGGLVTRNAVNQRPELFSGVVYAGVPQGCVNILGPLRNGDDVLLSSRVLTAQVNFSIRTSFALLPLDGRCFINKTTKEEYPVDFFDVKHWIEYRLSPCIAPPLPPLVTQPVGRLSGLIGSVSGALPDFNLPFRKRQDSQPRGNSEVQDMKTEATSTLQYEKATSHAEGGTKTSGIALQMGGNQKHNPAEYGQSTNTNVATAVTIPRDKALEYLTRTLAEVKQFKQDCNFIPSHAENNIYPPVSVMYGKSEPTVYGARVDGKDGIKRADAYDDLAFASGDGVVLARQAMLPEGYKAVRGGVIATERGHVTLLGDLEALGRCLNAVMAGRKLGIGLGK